MFVRFFPRQCKQVWRKQNETREKEKREKEGGGEKERKKKERGEKNARVVVRGYVISRGGKIEGIKGNKNKRRTGLQRNDTGSRYYAVFKTRLLKRSPGRNAKSVYPISSVQCFSYTRANESLVIIRAGYRVPRAWFIQRGQTEFPPFVMLRINRWIKRNV